MVLPFINGVLCEMDDSAYFYRDYDPHWSPVVHAPNEAVNKLYKAITGISYPVIEFGEDGYELDTFKKILELKEAAGFTFHEEVFEQINKIPENVGGGLQL